MRLDRKTAILSLTLSAACWGGCSHPLEQEGDFATRLDIDYLPLQGAVLQFFAQPRGAPRDRHVAAALRWTSSTRAVVALDAKGLGHLRDSGVTTIVAATPGYLGAGLVLVTRDATFPLAAGEVLSHDRAVEALFLGTGPMATEDDPYSCPFPGRWAGFPSGTAITVLISTTVAATVRDTVTAALSLIAEVTRGRLAARARDTAEPDPRPDRHQVTVTTGDPLRRGCPSASGCTLHRFEDAGLFHSSRSILPADQHRNAYVHDVLGHAILGLCHIKGWRLGTPAHSLMSSGPGVFSNDIATRLSDLDREIVASVWSSGVEPGAGRGAFVAAGLVSP